MDHASHRGIKAEEFSKADPKLCEKALSRKWRRLHSLQGKIHPARPGIDLGTHTFKGTVWTQQPQRGGAQAELGFNEGKGLKNSPYTRLSERCAWWGGR